MSVRVVARIRPLLSSENEKDTIIHVESNEEGKPSNVVRIPNPKKEAEDFSFTFNAVYDQMATQDEFFVNEVAPHVKSLFQGLDVTIFAYGVTGTGKTHTMRGGLKLAERGVIPRLLSSIYRRGRKVLKDSAGRRKFSVSLAYYEIYNDKVYDLFQPPEKRTLAGLPLREKDGKTIVVGLSEHACDNLKDFERFYIEANNNRSTAGTKLNAQSSRSHAILQVKLIQVSDNGEILISTASAIDLAGSEDNRRTENNKERLVESASINKSLFVLSSCIDAIGRGDKRIPYRESRMTRILSLGQNQGITIMILNLAPLRSYHLDTLSSLNISSRAKRIEVREIENEIVFTQPSWRPASSSSNNTKRQPLRSLAHAHNTHPSNTARKSDKPTKSFAVYTDKSRAIPRPANSISLACPKDPSLKRPSENLFPSRPNKKARSAVTNSTHEQPSTSTKIELLIEQKIQEALANRIDNQIDSKTNAVSDALQQRLEALERKIQNGEEEHTRAEGLRYLLMAKQHKERDQFTSALRMYELAVPYFPGQERLQKKIESLKAKIQRQSDQTAEYTRVHSEDPISSNYNTKSALCRKNMRTYHQGSIPKSERENRDVEDEEFHDKSAPVHSDEDETFTYRPKLKRPRIKPGPNKATIRIYTDVTEPFAGFQTPRTRHLLDIVNSRDLTMIQGLSGVGAKKARDLVEYLELQDEDSTTNLRTLQDLMAVPGLGKKSIEKAYEGLTSLLV
ncbi:unnamed protein product [Blumeria hordei]|uniref:Kinesin-like protein KIF22 n=1 Tax=Blumeria hordei TaxID=2867405 RepID=A0A383ULR2_BLUHO|nr:unnamed protein product [Blumeria hordei]